MAEPSRRRQSFHHAPPQHNFSSSSVFASSSSGFAVKTPAAGFFHRDNPRSTAASVRFSVDRSASSGGSLSASSSHTPAHARVQRRTCMCSPTSHPGSFRCSLHKSGSGSNAGAGSTYSPNRLNARRSAMTNSLVRIGGVEGGDLVKRALAALIRPSSHQQRRRNGFRPRRSRLSAMTKAEDL